MLSYKKIQNKAAQSWNSKLLKTNASYFQYPYYGSGHEGLPYSNVAHYELYEQDTCIGFATILEVRIGFIQIGLIIRGPVVLEAIHSDKILNLLKSIQKSENYFFIRLNPNISDIKLINILDNDISVLKKDFFPIYKGSQDRDFVIKNIDNTEESLLKFYKPRARQKIRFAGEENFTYYTSKSTEDLKRVYNMFMKLSLKKEFIFRSLDSYTKILKNGADENLVELHIIEENGEIINAVMVLKDRDTAVNFSSGLISGNYRTRNSPGAFLHHEIIKKTLLNEGREHYNISYTTPDHPVYEFKTLFNPREINYSSFYTITNQKLLSKLFLIFVNKYQHKIKKLLRRKHGNKQ